VQITDIIQTAKTRGASDIHISANHPPILRVHGQMVPLRVESLNVEQVRQIIHSVMTEPQRKVYEEEKDIDFAMQHGGDRYRVNAFTTLNGPAAVMRAVPSVIPTLTDLKVPPVVTRLSTLEKGLVLVTGPTGSGKSTTIAAMLHYLNQHVAKHIITLEDPIEYIHNSNMSLINQREIGVHAQSFGRALKSTLREDPDVIVVGELRDLETIRAALTAAETGHLVISTIHTSSAAQTIERIIDVFPSEDKDTIRAMLAGSLEGVISQRLMRRADNQGSIAGFEVLISSSAIRNLIREGKIPQIYSAMQVGAKHGMITMKDSVEHLLREGLITEEAGQHVLNAGDVNAMQEAKLALEGKSVSEGGF
jgi:twitching motility protein PilT